MAGTAANIRVGACQITFNSVDLGHTLGGVKIKYNPKYTELNVDQYGKTRLDMALLSEMFEVDVPLAEVVYQSWKYSMPVATATAGTGTAGKIVTGANAGALLSASAFALTLHPLAKSAGDTGEDITVFKAVVFDIGDVEYSPDKQRVINVQFTGLIDETQPVGQRLFRIGPANVS